MRMILKQADCNFVLLIFVHLCFQGQLDIPLSDNGINQAKLLAKTLQNVKWKEVFFLHIHPVHIVICVLLYLQITGVDK